MVPGGYVPQKYFGVSNNGLIYCMQLGTLKQKVVYGWPQTTVKWEYM